MSKGKAKVISEGCEEKVIQFKTELESVHEVENWKQYNRSEVSGEHKKFRDKKQSC